MLKNNSMRFGADNFSFSKSALLTSKQPFDATTQSSVEGFVISGIEPANSARRFIFKVDDTLKYFVNNAPVDYPYQGELNDVLLYGNTAAELETLTSIAAWVGKKIFPIIALSAPAESAALPTVRLALKVRSSSEVYEKSVESAEYELSGVLRCGGHQEIRDVLV